MWFCGAGALGMVTFLDSRHFHQNDFVCPPWYWGNSNYWPFPAPWQTHPLPVGGLLANGIRPEIKIQLLNKAHLESQSFMSGGFISLLADVNVSDQEIDSVLLFVNGNLESNASILITGVYQDHIYEAQWQPAYDGIYELQLVALDSSQNFSASSQVVDVNVSSTYDWTGGLPAINIMNPNMDDFYTTKSSIHLTASSADPDFDLKEVQFYLNGSKIGDPISTPVSGYSDFYPYFKRWDPQTSGIHFIYAVATDYFGNSQMSSAVAVRVSEGTSLPPKPQYSGIVQVAEVQAQLVW